MDSRLWIILCDGGMHWRDGVACVMGMGNGRSFMVVGLWNFVFQSFGVVWVLPGQVKDLLFA